MTVFNNVTIVFLAHYYNIAPAPGTRSCLKLANNNIHIFVIPHEIIANTDKGGRHLEIIVISFSLS